MSESDHDRMIAEFCKVTGIEASRAAHYLEAHGWNSELAMSSYFEEGEEDNEEMESIPSVPPPARGKPKPSVQSGGARIATFSSLGNDEDNEEEGQAFYAGGSERSGQQVLGPGKRKAGNEAVEEIFKAVKQLTVDVDDILEELFEAFEQHGGEVVDPASGGGPTTSLRAFSGSGFVLGSTPGDAARSQVVQGNRHPQPAVDVQLQLWRDGFTVDDGPMRDYRDPVNKEFLDAIRRGEIPRELLHKPGDPEINLSVEDRSHDEYVPKKPIVKAFSGTGFRLGNITPTVSSAAAGPSEQNDSQAQQDLKVDDSKPVTTLQIRLANGSKLEIKANQDHTVGDVRRFIVTARPEYSASVFILMTAFPPKELTSDEATLEEEKLLNSVIVQRLK